MVTFPPLAPSTLWWADFLQNLSSGQTKERSVAEANRNLKSAKEFGRFSLCSPKNEILPLSLAVEGGGKQLREIERRPEIYLSEHGNWRKNHLGAIEACLGKKPFYRELEPAIKRVYQDLSIRTLEGFNTAISEALFTFLMGNIKEDSLKEFRENPAVRARGKEVLNSMNKEISLIQNLAVFGRETLLGLMVADN